MQITEVSVFLLRQCLMSDYWFTQSDGNIFKTTNIWFLFSYHPHFIGLAMQTCPLIDNRFVTCNN
jgi:hypothetical protein